MFAQIGRGRTYNVNQILNVRKFFGVTFFEKKVTKILTQTNYNQTTVERTM